MKHIVPKKTSYVAQCLTGVVVSPNAETERSKCGSVEVAYYVEHVGPMAGLLEVKQPYISRNMCIKALSSNKGVSNLKITLFVLVSLLRPQRSFSQAYFNQHCIVYFSLLKL